MNTREPGKHALLLVDDEPEILFSLKGLLRREFDLYTATNGEEALEILRQHPIQVIMTDQRMPEMTGVELMSRVKTEFPDAIRIVFTGYADIKAVVDAINSGGLYRYITKPWDPDELVTMLHAAAGEYDAVVERRTLMTDMRSFVEQSRDFAHRHLTDGRDTDDETARRVTENADRLIQRLRRLED